MVSSFAINPAMGNIGSSTAYSASSAAVNAFLAFAYMVFRSSPRLT